MSFFAGYEKNAEECKEFITKAFADFQSLISLEITLDARIHSRLIGQRGKNIRKVQSVKFSARLKEFPLKMCFYFEDYGPVRR